LERTVQDFLKFARPADPELQLLPVTTLLETTRDLLQSGLAEKSVELKLEAQTDQLVRIDLDKMKQVLINFIQNGADSIEGAGTVTVRARKDRQPLNGRTTDVVVIDIIDTGKGMPPEVQKRLFDPFFTTKEKGTGLGLPIAARIVEKHGGVIQYETAPGRGTTFSILLPSAPKHEIESSSAAH
ncbi:MAG TPA: ATP-binding protein, partial [Verrucomicrobiota bacterium]|nr:ATP-binding protein [Verrucomicrobiota bacterium]